MNESSQEGHPLGNWHSGTTWLLVGVSVLWNVIGRPVAHVPDPSLLMMIALAFVLLHGGRRYGFAGLAVYVAAAWIVSNALENCSILTGFPFGYYHYADALRPKIFRVPVNIGPFYIAIGYLSWYTADALLEGAQIRLGKGINVVLLPVVAAAVMTSFDLATDPSASTLGGIWIWERGGGYFGVPYTNFLGWWLVTYLFFQVFALYLRGRPEVACRAEPALSRLQPIILYFNLGFTVVVDCLVGSARATVTDPAGVVWNVANIRSSMCVVFAFSGAVFALVAVARLFGTADVRERRVQGV